MANQSKTSTAAYQKLLQISENFQRLPGIDEQESRVDRMDTHIDNNNIVLPSPSKSELIDQNNTHQFKNPLTDTSYNMSNKLSNLEFSNANHIMSLQRVAYLQHQLDMTTAGVNKKTEILQQLEAQVKFFENQSLSRLDALTSIEKDLANECRHSSELQSEIMSLERKIEILRCSLWTMGGDAGKGLQQMYTYLEEVLEELAAAKNKTTVNPVYKLDEGDDVSEHTVSISTCSMSTVRPIRVATRLPKEIVRNRPVARRIDFIPSDTEGSVKNLPTNIKTTPSDMTNSLQVEQQDEDSGCDLFSFSKHFGINPRL